MSRQVALGGVIGFLLTVVLMAVCQKSEPAPPPATGVTRVDNLEPAKFDEPVKVLPAPMPLRPPVGQLPSIVRPINVEGFDAGHR